MLIRDFSKIERYDRVLDIGLVTKNNTSRIDLRFGFGPYGELGPDFHFGNDRVAGSLPSPTPVALTPFVDPGLFIRQLADGPCWALMLSKPGGFACL